MTVWIVGHIDNGPYTQYIFDSKEKAERFLETNYNYNPIEDGEPEEVGLYVIKTEVR